MPKTALTMTLHVDGLRQVLAGFNTLGKDANKRLREGSLQLAGALATSAQSAARASSPQAALMASTVRAIRDRVPVVSAGGAKRVGGVPAWAILFGAEFGMNRRSGWYAASRYAGSDGRQFRPHRGRVGYWFFPTVEREQATVWRQWVKVANDVARDFEAAR